MRVVFFEYRAWTALVIRKHSEGMAADPPIRSLVSKYLPELKPEEYSGVQMFGLLEKGTADDLLYRERRKATWKAARTHVALVVDRYYEKMNSLPFARFVNKKYGPPPWEYPGPLTKDEWVEYSRFSAASWKEAEIEVLNEPPQIG